MKIKFVLTLVAVCLFGTAQVSAKPMTYLETLIQTSSKLSELKKKEESRLAKAGQKRSGKLTLIEDAIFYVIDEMHHAQDAEYHEQRSLLPTPTDPQEPSADETPSLKRARMLTLRIMQSVNKTK